MHVPGTFSLVLLAYLFLFLPWGAWKSARYLDVQRAKKSIALKRAGVTSDDAAMPSPARIYVNTLFNMVLLFWLSFAAAREYGYPLFAVPQFGAREWLACAAWFVASFLVGLLSRAWRSAEELRTMPVLTRVPRTTRDWLAFVAVACAAGVAEEAAYRGMGFQALSLWTGSAIVAGVAGTIAFALAHWVQGGKSMVIVFVKGLLLQALVWYTGTLVGAMIGHALLDIVTAYRSRTLIAANEATTSNA
jgi:membrane protease YdiL (CAAX protease family)